MSNHILIVEDNASTRELFMDILHAFKFRTTVLRTGQQVVDYFEDDTNERPNLLLLDINLPEKNGVYVLQYLRGKLQLNHLKILVITANHIAGQMPEMDLADIVMTKPFLPNTLKAKIDMLLAEQAQASSAPQDAQATPDEEDPESTMETPPVHVTANDDQHDGDNAQASMEINMVEVETSEIPPLETTTDDDVEESLAG